MNNKDYDNFVARMGSFEDAINLDELQPNGPSIDQIEIGTSIATKLLNDDFGKKPLSTIVIEIED